MQVPRKLIGSDAFQETPIVEVTRQITKHNFLVMDVKDIPRIVKEAFYLARTGRPGVVGSGAGAGACRGQDWQGLSTGFTGRVAGFLVAGFWERQLGK